MTDTPQRALPITAAPVPFLTGNTITSEDGAAHTVATVTVTITAEDGTEQTMTLENRFGGWWAPANA